MIITLGDLHLGRVPYGKPGLASLILRQGSFMLNFAANRNQDLVYLAGDVYDRPEVTGSESTVMTQAIANKRTDINSIEGNHDSRRKARNGLRAKSLSIRNSPFVSHDWGAMRGWSGEGGLVLVDWVPKAFAATFWTEAAMALADQRPVPQGSDSPLLLMIGHQSIDGPGYSSLAGVSSSIELSRSTVPSSIDLVILGDYHCPSKAATIYRGPGDGDVPFVYTGTTFSRFHVGRVTWPRGFVVHGAVSTEHNNVEGWWCNKINSIEQRRDVPNNDRSMDLVGEYSILTWYQRMQETVVHSFPGFSRILENPVGSLSPVPGFIVTPQLIKRPAGRMVEFILCGSVAVSPMIAAMWSPYEENERVSFLATVCVPELDEEFLVVDMMGELMCSTRPGADHPSPVEVATAIGDFCGKYDADCVVNLRCPSGDSLRWREAFAAVRTVIHLVESSSGVDATDETGEITLSRGNAAAGFRGWLLARLEDTPGLIPPGIDPDAFRRLCEAAMDSGINASPDQLLELARSGVVG